jgi:hypothetical protein
VNVFDPDRRFVFDRNMKPPPWHDPILGVGDLQPRRARGGFLWVEPLATDLDPFVNCHFAEHLTLTH